jgi:transcriptional regulator with XRE-family HTH domain
VDDVRVGRLIRALRLRLHWRQADLALRSGVSQQEVSVLERGHLDAVPLRTLRSLLRALDASVQFDVRWRGGAVDRLLDERHAALVGETVARLTEAGWETRVEVTYSVYGERGSIDVLGWYSRLHLLLVVEVKSELTSIEQTLRKHDEKCRLASREARERFGWQARASARLLVASSDRTTRRRVSRASPVLEAAYPIRGVAVRMWLRAPATAPAGLLWLTDTSQRSGRRPIARLRARKAS